MPFAFSAVEIERNLSLALADGLQRAVAQDA